MFIKDGNENAFLSVTKKNTHLLITTAVVQTKHKLL